MAPRDLHRMKHLKETGMSYFQHMLHALYIGAFLVIAGFCCITHSFAPFVFKNTASKIITHLNDDVIKKT